MIEIQCTSCHTRYRIDERVLPDDTPTFKCSRCGHVFNADPVPPRVRKMAPETAEPEAEPPRTVRPPRAKPSQLKSPLESDVVKREPIPDQQPAAPVPPERRVQPSQPADVVRAPVERKKAVPPPPPNPEVRPESREASAHDDPLSRPFGDRDQKADTGENFKFDFNFDRGETREAEPERELERPDHDDGWQVGDTPSEFASAPNRRAPTMMDEPEAAQRRAAASAQPRRMGAPIQADIPRFAERPPIRAGGFQLGHAVSAAADAASSSIGTHSSALFLALFFFVTIGFLGASALICDEPAASARILSQAPGFGDQFASPIVPAMVVALHDVHSQYYQLKGGHVALVVSGKVQNVGARPLHLIEIDANLIGAGARALANQNVFCGNELSPTMLGEMTPREIEFSQGLSPPRTFVVNPSASAPFLMVFVDPPTGAYKLRLSVSKASTSTIADSSTLTLPPA